MSIRISRGLWALLCIALFAGSSLAAPYQYHVVTYPLHPNTKNNIALPLDINNRRNLAGYSRIFESGVANTNHATWFQHTHATDMTPLQQKATSAYAINDDDVLAGTRTRNIFGTDRVVPVVYVNTNSLDLTPIAGSDGWGIPYAVRNHSSADIVGETTTANDVYHATLWTQIGATTWSVSDLGTLADNDAFASSGAKDINKHGDIVGWSHSALTSTGTSGLNTHPFYKPAGGAMMDLNLLPGAHDASSGYAEAVNDGGLVVGWLDDLDRPSNADDRAWAWSASTGMYEIAPPPGYSECRATDVSNNGVVIGQIGNLSYDTGYMVSFGVGQTYNFDDLLTDAFAGWDVNLFAINDRMQIACNGRDASGNRFVGYAAPVAGVQNFVSQGTFGAPGALPAGWTATGPGSASVVADPTDPANHVLSMITGSPIIVSQAVDTPAGPFMVQFDYLFASATGTLDVLIDGVVVDTLDAPDPLQAGWLNGGVVIEDPLLLGLSGVELAFAFDGVTGSQVLVDNIELRSLVLVPEPASLALLGLGAFLVNSRRRSLRA